MEICILFSHRPFTTHWYVVYCMKRKLSSLRRQSEERKPNHESLGMNKYYIRVRSNELEDQQHVNRSPEINTHKLGQILWLICIYICQISYSRDRQENVENFNCSFNFSQQGKVDKCRGLQCAFNFSQLGYGKKMQRTSMCIYFLPHRLKGYIYIYNSSQIALSCNCIGIFFASKCFDEFCFDLYLTFLPLRPLGWRGIVVAWVHGRHPVPCERDNSSQIACIML